MNFIDVTFASTQSPILSSTTEPWDIVLLVISIFVLVSWVLSILFILWWGLLMILSWWKEDKIAPALNTIRYAILGVIVTVVTIFLFPILGRLLWLDVEKYAKPSRIFEKIEELWSNVFWSWTSSYKVNSWSSDINTLPDNFNDL